jgi:hypothetical protein
MAQNMNVTKETFGTDAKDPKVKKGHVCVIGHMINDGEALPARGTPNGSTNVKTGYPANDVK